MGFRDRVRSFLHSWNAFVDVNQDIEFKSTGSTTYGPRPDRVRLSFGNERSIVASILMRIAVDFSGAEFRHVRTDDEGRYSDDIDSSLNECLTLKANMDQGARHFRRDIAMTLFDRGSVAIVPVDTTLDPSVSGGYDIQSMRVGEIVGWHPDRVRVRLYNDQKGIRQDITLEKKYVAIVENPFGVVMNEPNSTLTRLIHKLNLLDQVDEQSSSGKLDLIIQLPYVIKSESKRQVAQQRRAEIEQQLKGSQYGIAYTDGTEKITQLNRPAENNLLAQIDYLTKLLYSQLGVTEDIMNGTADEATMLNYLNRTVEPVLDAVGEAMRSTFLTKTARSQKQSIMYFRDPFKLVPISQIAEVADKLSRNKITAPNEIRVKIGLKPSKDPSANKLENANMPTPTPAPSGPNPKQQTGLGGNSQNGSGLQRLRN